MIGDGARVYAQEPSITVRYDAEGFRNPDDLDDWEIVVTGDSFTELGYLRHEDLFTSVAARELGRRVKNLGTSCTGPFAQTAYLEHYGVAPSTRDAVLVFSEGSDLEDLVLDHQALEHFERTGERPYREIENQSSFVKALLSILKRQRKKARAYGGAEVEIGGVLQPITVTYAPPSSDQLSELEVALIDRSLERWSRAARGRGIEPWVAYMPSKVRVLHERLMLNPSAKQRVRDWRPNDLPRHVESVAVRHGAHFIDLTPALRQTAAEGELPFNPIWDSHINRAGSLAVGRALADALAGDSPKPVTSRAPRGSGEL
jgi:hypothetical protein